MAGGLKKIQPLLVPVFLQLPWYIVIFSIARFAMYVAFVKDATHVSRDDFLTLWLTGLRYDLRIAASVGLVLLLFGVLSLIPWKRWRAILVRAIPFLSGIISFFVIFLTIANYFYYQTYHTHIDIFAFGIINDDTKAVLINMWDDYPIVWVFFATVILSFVGYLLGRVKNIDVPYSSRENITKNIVVSIFVVLLLFSLARGSFGLFPFDRDTAPMPQDGVLNRLTPNAIMALGWAIQDYKDDRDFIVVKNSEKESLLKKLDIASLYKRTKKNLWLAKNPPHVVFNFMESFGSNVLVLDKFPENNLLGSLRDAFQKDFVFERFVSEDNGTAPSLAALFFNSTSHNISHNSAQKVVLKDTPFKVFKSRGYQVIFISPGNLMWRNLANYLPLQGVDKVFDQNTLMKFYPESKKELTPWGLPDEYAYRLSFQLLEESREPLFLVVLTVTNHPPYVVPKHYTPYPVKITEEVKAHIEGSEEEKLQILRTFQYASDAFGQFIQQVKKSPLRKKTLIAATGDHSLRRVKAYLPQELALDRAVPFYLYVPPEVQQHTELKYAPLRVGSHKDIFPTLFSYSLSNTEYLALGGRNLLARTDDTSYAFGYNSTLWIHDSGVYPLNVNGRKYAWKDKRSLYVLEKSFPVEKKQQEKIFAYPALLRWHTNAMVKGTIENPVQ